MRSVPCNRAKKRRSPRRKHVSDRRNRFVSLFCGCGGFDLGLLEGGMVPVGGFDLSADAIHHYRKNVCDRGEVTDLTTEAPRISESPDVVIAGPPCQGFSTAGKRDVGDERNHLLPLAGRLAENLRAKVIIIENVAAAGSGGHRKYWDELDAFLRGKGYRSKTLRCNAADLGLAQSRRRLILIAWRTGKEVNFDLPELPHGRLDEALAGVEGLPNHDPEPLPPGSRQHLIAARIGPGQKLCNVRGGNRSIHTWNIPEVFGETTAAECRLLEFVMRVRRQERVRTFGDADPVSFQRIEQIFNDQARTLVDSLLQKGYLRRIGHKIDLCHSFNGKFRRFQWEDKACTVDTRFGEAQLFLHPNEHRPFTVREAARIQGFPDKFVFECGNRTAFRLIGNAVPPRMGRLVAGFAQELLRT